MFNAEGGLGVDGPDLVVIDQDWESRGVDAKTFDCAPHKRYFAINDNKHAMLRDVCGWYFALLVPAFGQHAALGRLVPYDHVERWDAWPLRAGNADLQGSLSRNLPIGKFISAYFSQPIDIEALRKSVFLPSEIERLTRDDAIRAELVRRVPGTEAYLQPNSSGMMGAR